MSITASSPDRPLVTSPIDFVIPVRPIGRLLRTLSPRVRALALLGAVLFAGGLGAAIFLLNQTSRNAATAAARDFDAALTTDAPQQAPPGAAEYLAGIRARYGGVESARVLGAHNHGVNAANTADERTYYQAEVLLGTARGPVVLRLDFDNHSLTSHRVTKISELAPGDAKHLGGADRRAVERAFAARGGRAAEPSDLLRPAVATKRPAAAARVVTPAAPTTPRAVHVKAPAALRCVQAAHGDVGKLQACAAN